MNDDSSMNARDASNGGDSSSTLEDASSSTMDASTSAMDASKDAEPDAMVPERCGTTFDDVPPEHLAYEAIHALYVYEITNGYETVPPTYQPDNKLSRAAAAVMLVRAEGESPSNVAYNAYFNDVANNSQAGYINRLKELNITTGCDESGTMFCPTNDTSRAAFAIFLIRALGESTSNAATNAYFDDVGAFAAPYVNRLYELNITKGCDTRKFCPSDPITRAQTAVLIAEAYNLSLEICGPR